MGRPGGTGTRIVIDVQPLQSATLTGEAGAYCVALLRALLARLGAGHALLLLAHRTLDEAGAAGLRRLAGDAAELVWFDAPRPTAACVPDNTWRRQAARLARESVLQALAPDAVLLLNAAEGYADDAVVSVRRLAELPTIALLPAGLPQSTRAEFQSWRREVLDDLARADAVHAGPGHALALDGLQAQGLPQEPEAAAATLAGALERLAAQPAAAPAAPVRPRLAYVSPLPPAASGIADYSAELLPALAECYDIELVPTGPAPAAHYAERFPVRDAAWLLAHAGRYDRVLYHFGNSPFHGEMVGLLRQVPGVVVLHDFYLGHLFGYAQHSGLVPMALWRALLRSHGPAALRYYRQEGEAAALARYPANLELFAQAEGIIVHSEHARQLAGLWYGPELPCRLDVVPLAHQSPAQLDARQAARRRLGIAEDALLVCSFGYAGEAKLSRELVEAWMGSGIRQGMLAIVGGHQFDGPYSQALEARVRDAASVRMTGFASAQVYRDYLAAADIAVQLRSGSRGETSRAVLDAMAHGAALIVNAHGSAAELPEDTVLRLDEDCSVAQIAAALGRLAGDPELRAALAQRAREYVVSVHDPARVAMRYRDAIEAAHVDAERSAAGRARAVRAALGRLPQPATPPGRAQLARLAGHLLRNHPQPQARQIPVDFAAPLPQRTQAPLCGLSLRAHAPREPRSGAQERARRMAALVREAGGVLDLLHVSGGPAEHWGEEAWALPVTAEPNPDWPKRLREGLPVLQAEGNPDAVERLAARLAERGYDFVQLEDPYGWPLLRAALRQAGARPAVVYAASRRESMGLPAALPDALARALAEAEGELLACADLVLCPDADTRNALVAAGAAADRVVRIGTGGGLPDADEARIPLVYRDHFSAMPYALILSGDDPAARAGFKAFMGTSLAFMPPDVSLIVAGPLADALRGDPDVERWRGVNHARARLLGEVDTLTQATLLRHAHVIVLPRLPGAGVHGLETKTVEALQTGAWVLATSSALYRLEASGDASRVVVEDDWTRFRARLLELFERPRPAPVVQPAAAAHWQADMAELPLRLRAAVERRRSRSAGEMLPQEG